MQPLHLSVLDPISKLNRTKGSLCFSPWLQARLWFIQMAPPFDHGMEYFEGSHSVFVPQAMAKGIPMYSGHSPNSQDARRRLVSTLDSRERNQNETVITKYSPCRFLLGLAALCDFRWFPIVFNVEKCLFSRFDCACLHLTSTISTEPYQLLHYEKPSEVIKNHQAHPQTNCWAYQKTVELRNG